MSNQPLQFSEQKLIYNFSITGSKPEILIKKIIIKSLIGQRPDALGPKLSRLNPFLQITFFKINGFYAEAPISIDAYLSPYHAQPIIEFSRSYPDRNNWNDIDISKFDSCKVEITYTPQDDVKPDIDVYYDSTDLKLAN